MPASVSRWLPMSVRARTTLLAALVVGSALTAGAILLLGTLQYSLERAGDTAAVTRVLAQYAQEGNELGIPLELLTRPLLGPVTLRGRIGLQGIEVQEL